MDPILEQLERIYPGYNIEFSPEHLEDVDHEFGEGTLAAYQDLPEDVRTVAEFLGFEQPFPHPRVPGLYGPWDIIEWNGPDGTFGQFRSDEGYAYDQVVKIGDDVYVDVAGQVSTPGAVLYAISHDVEGSEVLAEDMLSFLQQARPADV